MFLEKAITQYFQENLFPITDEKLLQYKERYDVESYENKDILFVDIDLAYTLNKKKDYVTHDLQKNIVNKIYIVKNLLNGKEAAILKLGSEDSYPRLILLTNDEDFNVKYPEVQSALDFMYGIGFDIKSLYGNFQESVAKKALETIGFTEEHMKNPFLFYLLKDIKAKGQNFRRRAYSKGKTNSIVNRLKIFLFNIFSDRVRSITQFNPRRVVSFDKGLEEHIFVKSLFFQEFNKRKIFYSTIDNQKSFYQGFVVYPYLMDKIKYDRAVWENYFQLRFENVFVNRYVSFIENKCLPYVESGNFPNAVKRAVKKWFAIGQVNYTNGQRNTLVTEREAILKAFRETFEEISKLREPFQHDRYISKNLFTKKDKEEIKVVYLTPPAEEETEIAF